MEPATQVRKSRLVGASRPSHMACWSQHWRGATGRVQPGWPVALVRRQPRIDRRNSIRTQSAEVDALPRGSARQTLHRPGRCAALRLSGPDSSRGVGDAVARVETGDQTDQESRSAGHGAAASVTVMDITILGTFLTHDDPDASLAVYRDTLGLEVRNDVAYGGMRWITVGPADQPGTSISGLPVRL